MTRYTRTPTSVVRFHVRTVETPQARFSSEAPCRPEALEGSDSSVPGLSVSAAGWNVATHHPSLGRKGADSPGCVRLAGDSIFGVSCQDLQVLLSFFRNNGQTPSPNIGARERSQNDFHIPTSGS
ncbi:hypothetical protein DPEC_G00124750 [Dallia pectoralis]|uniref:Uncharacterized protein n=1 Tax=Dallia pectoralis TaxID=75939 RepID=A0ACC2GRP9_DALPE|nr:hypothetical protein DPEC_G00124750 [Dallia pectoralis]